MSEALTSDERLRLHTAIDWAYPPTDEDVRRAVDHAKVCEEVERILAARFAALNELLARWDDDSKVRHAHWAAVPRIRAALDGEVKA